MARSEMIETSKGYDQLRALPISVLSFTEDPEFLIARLTRPVNTDQAHRPKSLSPTALLHARTLARHRLVTNVSQTFRNTTEHESLVWSWVCKLEPVTELPQYTLHNLRLKMID